MFDVLFQKKAILYAYFMKRLSRFEGLSIQGKPINDNVMINILTLEPRGNRPIKMTFEDQPKMLISFPLEEFAPVQELLQVISEWRDIPQITPRTWLPQTVNAL
ncbi:MAG: hypothetical protein ACOWYE_02930 [Desulfatiglandales bacterium]